MLPRVLGACLILALSASAQVNGRFYLERTQFSPTQPVFVYLKITNNGPEPIDLGTPDADQPMCAGVSNKLFRNGIRTPACVDWAEEACVINGGGWPGVHLLPGQSHTDRYLLNYRHDLRVPGDYRVESQRIGFPDDRLKTVKATLLFHIGRDAAPISSGEIQSWVSQLHSPDVYKREEAARTLASIAPRSLERTLLDFVNNPEFQKYALLALYRLQTQRSMQALADLLRNSASENFELMEARRFLAASGDQQWYPVLLAGAQKSPQNSDLTYAAEVGGKRSISDLVETIKTSVNFASYGRAQAIMALGSTHSREAIPVLLDLLKSGDEDTSDRAASSLLTLTHRTAFVDPQTRDHNLEVIKWTDWWQHEGATAHIYRDDECADPVPLP